MKKVIAAAGLVILPLAFASSADGQGTYAWNYYRALDPDPFQAALTLQYGVPETDDILFSASCVIGANHLYAVVDIYTDIGTYAGGQSADVQFVANGFDRVINGTVIEGYATGISLAIEMDDPLWAAIRDKSVLYFNLTGLTAVEISLRGSSGPTSDFVSDCAAGRFTPADYGAAGPVEAAAASGPGATLSCASISKLRSRGDGQPATVTFVNATDGYRAVMWIDYDGNPVEYAALNAGHSFVQETYSGHPWMITDGPGNCLEIYDPAPGDNLFNITAMGNFGPE